MALWVGRTAGCEVTGVDLSGVRVGNAQETLAAQPAELRSRVRFDKASATDLPFADDSFTHVWSQSTLYHVHEQERTLREAYRVLAPGGTLVFDDLFKPQPTVSAAAQRYVFDRLLFDTEYNFESYQHALESIGFRVVEATDLTPHLAKSHARLAEMAEGHNGEHAEHYAALALAYRESASAGEVGWALFVCHKPLGL